MLFRRVLEHVRSHDWIAVVIDFLIVVVGIFVGLQVDQWNQDRKERILETQYIQSIKKDLQADLDELDRMIQRAKDRAQIGRFLIKALDEGEVGEDSNKFVWAVYVSQLLNYPSYTRGTMDELLSTGHLRIIQNDALKSELARYYARIDTHEQFKTNWREMQIALEHTIPAIIDFPSREAGHLRYVGGPPWIDREFDFDAEQADTILKKILVHPLAKGQIENMVRIQDSQFVNLSRIRERAAKVFDTL